jgi:hypothetical protein
MDNYSSHKIPLTIKIIKELAMPVIFSAPASFLAIPIEGVFGALKAVDFDTKPDPDPRIMKKRHLR